RAGVRPVAAQQRGPASTQLPAEAVDAGDDRDAAHRQVRPFAGPGHLDLVDRVAGLQVLRHRGRAPPLTWITWAVTCPAAGETRYSMAAATSSGSPARPVMVSATSRSWRAGVIPSPKKSVPAV